eukprot:scaffold7449_cov430-Prasinococcus_capsulatus_cf.AAC.1
MHLPAWPRAQRRSWARARGSRRPPRAVGHSATQCERSVVGASNWHGYRSAVRVDSTLARSDTIAFTCWSSSSSPR